MAKRRKQVKKAARPRRSDEEAKRIVSAFDKALAAVTEARPAIAKARHNPKQLVSLLSESLALYDEALDLYATAKRTGWSRKNTEDVEGAYHRVSWVLEDELELERNLPFLSTNRTVLLEHEGVFLQRDASVPPTRRKAESCCFTRIVVENILGSDIRVTASDDDGLIESADFGPGDSKPLTFKDGRGRVVPGGIGRCVTIEVRVKRLNGSFAEPHTWRICCDDQGVRPGFELTRRFDHGNNHFSSITPLRITRIDAITPCPEMARAEGASPHGTPSGRIGAIPGLRLDDRDYYYGSACRMRFVPRPGGCRNVAFVQGVSRKVEIQRPGQPAPQPAGGMSTDDRFHLDIPKGQPGPAYPHTRDVPGGGKEMTDTPGVQNPWGRFELDGKNVRLPRGTVMIVTWTFRTWVVCLDGPVRVLGRFDWSVKLTLTVGRDERDTAGQVEMQPPRWNNDPDLDNYRRVVREASRPDGFLPPG